jgi:hypothetical protein
MLPIFIVHKGSQDYLYSAIQLSRAHGNYTVLIGSDPIAGSLCNGYYDLKNTASSEYNEFEKNYIHMSSNSYEFELLCFKRYFDLLKVAASQNIKSFWMIDSDVILLSNLKEFTQDVLIRNQFWAALSTPVQESLDWASSPHISFWTIEALSNFVSFLRNMYANPMIERLQIKYNHHSANNLPGGICDMTALFLWQQEHRVKIFNTAQAHLDGYGLFDHNINMEGNYFPKEFVKNPLLKIKKISFSKRIYFAKPINSMTLIPVVCLHFQGSAKKFIPLFLRFKNISYTTSLIYKILRWKK